MRKHPSEVLISPIITERSMDLTTRGKYTFAVYQESTKTQIKHAVQDQFEVEVEKVNTMKLPGKPRRAGRHEYETQPRKKAIVTLKEGQSIPDILNAV